MRHPPLELWSQLREMLNQIIDWLKRNFPQAKAVLKANAPMLKRLQTAAQVIKGKRLVLVLDRFDTLMKPQDNRQWDISHPQLALLLVGQFVL